MAMAAHDDAGVAGASGAGAASADDGSWLDFLFPRNAALDSILEQAAAWSAVPGADGDGAGDAGVHAAGAGSPEAVITPRRGPMFGGRQFPPHPTLAVRQEPFWDVVQGFFHAVDWQQPWIIGLLCFHVAIVVLVVRTRRNMAVQSVTFVCLCGLVASAKWINDFLRPRWMEFSTDNYFDKRGVFLSVMLSLPLSLLLLFQLLNFVRAASDLLVQVKRMEVRRSMKQQKETGKEDDGVGSGKGSGQTNDKGKGKGKGNRRSNTAAGGEATAGDGTARAATDAAASDGASRGDTARPGATRGDGDAASSAADSSGATRGTRRRKNRQSGSTNKSS